MANPKAPQVLLVEDDPGDARAVRALLSEAAPFEFEIIHFDRLGRARLHLQEVGAACVLLDLTLPDAEGLEAVLQIRSAAPDVPIVVLGHHDDEATAVRAVQQGAQDYLIKDRLDTQLLRRSIRYAMERKRAEARLAHQALHDPLTGLPNRTLFLDRLARALARLERHPSWVAVLFLDLDHFKEINDTRGHLAGDQVLVAVGRRLQAVLRPSDTVGRFGGDEFTILCEDVAGRDNATAIAARVGQVMTTPFHIEDDGEATLSVSIGIALVDESRTSPEAMIRDADAAMYMAKQQGKGRWALFEASMPARAAIETRARERGATMAPEGPVTVVPEAGPPEAVPRRDEEESTRVVNLETGVVEHAVRPHAGKGDGLRDAFERGELRVFYQPKVGLTEGRIVSVEALIRWFHPDRGMLAPGEFISRAEDSGLIVPIGEWVLAEACRQAGGWQAAHSNGSRLRLVVNLSERELASPGLPDAVSSVLSETGFSADTLCVEVAERVLLDGSEETGRTLRALRDLGLGLWMDDFGETPSSLRRLRGLPIIGVNLNRELVEGMVHDPWDWAIVAAAVTVAHGLGMQVIAEGVETVEQLGELRDLGCDVAQGYYFATPQPPESLNELLTQNIRW